jgi:SAM-dependent methyltransferase
MAGCTIEEIDLLPAIRTEGACAADLRPARNAQGRVEQVQAASLKSAKVGVPIHPIRPYYGQVSSQPPKLFDRNAIAAHKERARRINGDAFLAREASEGLIERLSTVRRKFAKALLLDGFGSCLFDRLDSIEFREIAALDSDERLLTKECGFDLAISILDLHSVNDLPGVLAQLRSKLSPDGLFLAALFGAETLHELRASLFEGEIGTRGGASPRVFPFADVRQLGQLLQRAGFALPVADLERTTVLYRELEDLVRDLRIHGETNALAGRIRNTLTRATWNAAKSHYASNHRDDRGRLCATFDLIYLMGWAPHESQQRPLRPGSAAISLAQVLGPVAPRERHD